MCNVEGVPARLPPRPRVIFLGDDETDYTERVPEPWLAPWVQAFWHLKCVHATTLRVPPDGCMDIINGHVVGSLTSVIVAELKPGDESFGVRLRPGAFTVLYGVPANELTDTDVALDDLVRKPPSLLAAAADADRPDPIAEAAMHQPNIKTLSRDSGYSERHRRRRVRATTGHSPRKLARIARMQALLAAGRGKSWTRTAAEFGYYDESHMINDIRALTDATPQALLAERADSPFAQLRCVGGRNLAR
jgi:AraC-like DNA-binding protein